ncbi:hypothetical protein H1C71_018975 [Ictidomys tridecemlineatus]|nr:hypothetical protein H1C71_018975 [Ictidomys tridecemlineatus]
MRLKTLLRIFTGALLSPWTSWFNQRGAHYPTDTAEVLGKGTSPPPLPLSISHILLSRIVFFKNRSSESILALLRIAFIYLIQHLSYLKTVLNASRHCLHFN